MNQEINLAKRILQQRHKKKVTQEELASYIGVSKAAVSKWESGSSFPDITCLPTLATYFNVSIDELMGYEPQLTHEEIRKKYQQLKENFVTLPWAEAFQICEDCIKKYYSCFPFLLQMAVLYMNHAVLSPAPQKVYARTVELLERVRFETDDLGDARQAVTFEVLTCLMMGEPMKALDLMDEKIRPLLGETELLAQVYQSIGKTEKANETYQIAMYQNLLALVSDCAPYLLLHATDREKSEEIIKRTLMLMEVFHLRELHPNSAAGIYLTIAQVYCMQNQDEEALDMLQKYVDLCLNWFFPFTLHGDDFFDQLEGWFKEFDIGNEGPRSDKLIKESMVQALSSTPAFDGLKDQKRFLGMLSRLKEEIEK